MFREKPGDRFWARVIDCDVVYDFTSGDTSFETVFVGGAGVGELMNAPPRRRPRPLGSGAGSYMLSQYVDDALSNSSLMDPTAGAGAGAGAAGAGAGASVGLARRPSYSQSQSQALSQDLDDLGLAPPGRRGRGAPSQALGTSSQASQYGTQAGAGLGHGLGHGHGAAAEVEVCEEESAPVRGFDDCAIALELQPVNRQLCMAAVVRRRPSPWPPSHSPFHGRRRGASPPLPLASLSLPLS